MSASSFSPWHLGTLDPLPPGTDLSKDRMGRGGYQVMIRSPTDPDRKPRPKGGQKDRAPVRTLKKTKPHDWYAPIQDLMGDGKPRTLNAIGVELIDKTGDITAGTPFEEAVWQLCGLEILVSRVEQTEEDKGPGFIQFKVAESSDRNTALRL